MDSKFKYLIYDIESVTDKPVLNKVLYPGEGHSDEEAFQLHLKDLAELQNGRDFVNPAFHQPISLAAMAVSEDYQISRIGLLGGDEKTTENIVRDFWDIYKKNSPILVDFNGKGFDVRLLELWAYRLGITIGQAHFAKFGARYKFADDKHIDLHEFMSNFGSIRFKGGLNLFAKLIGKPGKMGTSGSKVQELYDAGKQFEINDYCFADTMDSYFVFLRTRVMRGDLTLKNEEELVKAAVEKMELKLKEEAYFKEYLNFLDLKS